MIVTNQFQSITCNFKPIIRYDSMEGRPYIVAPMVMLTEGVHNGSNGALFYPREELSKTPAVWNHKPIVVYHPSSGTACDPDILTNRKIGIIMNTRFEDGKLKAEAWLEESRIKEVDNRILDAIQNNKMMELSTGLFTDNEEISGKYGDEEYIAIAKNYRPDHLAILPDLKGACSIDDGAGFLRLNSENSVKQEKMDPQKVCIRLNYDKLVINDKSYREIAQELSQQIKEGWIEDVFEDYFIYGKGGDNSYKMYKQGYIVDNGIVKLKGVTEEVVRTVSYVTKNDKILSKNFERTNKMDKSKLIESLILNENTQWKKEDEAFLNTLSDDVLQKMVPIENKKNENKEQENEKEDEREKAVCLSESEKNDIQLNTDKPQTVEEYIKNAPKDIQEVLLNGLNSFKQEKAKLIAKITANKKNIFSKEQLESKNIQELQAIAALAVETVNNYSGQGDSPDIVENAEEPLIMPVLNFNKNE